MRTSHESKSAKGGNISDNLGRLLNPPQIEAVRCVEGPLLVLAGAGTGKTRVITHRIAYMIENGIPSDCIAGMTFTNKAAREMRERINSMLSRDEASKVFLGTFHAFCARILRREVHRIGFTSNFTIADDSDQNAVIRQALLDCDMDKDDFPPALCLSLISKAKSALKNHRFLALEADDPFDVSISKVYERYVKILENQNMLDFDDMLLFTSKIFEEHSEVLNKYNDIYRYILVDEYQDTNMVQFKLIRQLAGRKMNVCAVGDDDQSIYGWRGANIKNILNFPREFSDCKVIALEQNYRSTTTILNVANSIISRNTDRHEKTLWSNLDGGDPIVIACAVDESDEADYVAKKICDVISGANDASYSDFAVLYRSNHQSRHFEDAMKRYGIPYRLVGSRSFYERREIRDAVAYIKLAINPKDDQSLLRIVNVPPKGIGDKAFEELKSLRAETGEAMARVLSSDRFRSKLSSKASAECAKFANVLDKWRPEMEAPGDLYDKAYGFLGEIGFLDGFIRIYKDRKEAEQRRDNVFELLNMMAEQEKRFSNPLDEPPTMLSFIEQYCLQDDNDRVKEDANGVTLMTVHAAKGLEFDSVFVTGMEGGIFPHERSLKEQSGDEERRLFYVAVTRAKKRLFLTRARSRMKFGEKKAQEPSPFLEEIPPELSISEDSTTCGAVLSPDEYEAALSKLFGNKKGSGVIYYDD